MARLSAELEQFFFAEERNAKVTLGDILTLAGERTFGFLFVLLALPSALPIPAPGYSIPFGVVLFVLAGQLVLGRQRPWLPKGWQAKGFDLIRLRQVVKAGLPWLRRIEVLSRPRLSYVCTTPTGRIVIGTAIALMAISMMIPIPGTNTLPAMGIFITGFGLLDDDGFISLTGLVVCVMGATLSGLIIFGGYEGAKFLLEKALPFFSAPR
ncbi:exopolysaccharide biosynthesis protein [Leptolyngbya sp. PCC 6406]|uniref:exopolysaccharide biosynthesis protein n=1 Tax=Leptolyngbya sp. PCC 6406 TaxID=1173264 RepID=UPI0002ACA4C8|nr:exopolysaccharide biosynthesis protein [Leptolyngbya sp. PCC 6406]